MFMKKAVEKTVVHNLVEHIFPEIFAVFQIIRGEVFMDVRLLALLKIGLIFITFYFVFLASFIYV
jgi:hypothetical protein